MFGGIQALIAKEKFLNLCKNLLKKFPKYIKIAKMHHKHNQKHNNWDRRYQNFKKFNLSHYKSYAPAQRKEIGRKKWSPKIHSLY
jgi:hypothetical protein